ncbi:MAG TPA: MXAN_6640 family putative metalloprotease [Clostridia bacterium]
MRNANIIRGSVFLDSNGNGMRDNSEEGLKDIYVGLYRGHTEYHNGPVSITRKHLVYSTKTDRSGNFIFYADPRFEYWLSIEDYKFPEGFDAVFIDKRVDLKSRSSIELAVTKSMPVNEKNINSTSDLCSYGKITSARSEGIIDETEHIKNLLYSLFDKRKLQQRFLSNVPIKSGTGAYEEIRRYIEKDDADKGVVNMARQYTLSAIPKLDRVYKSPSGYFNIHYTTTGKHSVPSGFRNSTPFYILKAGEALDNVKALTCGTRGFKEPRLKKDANTYDIYVYDLDGIYGVTFAKSISNKNAAGTRTASGHICIDNNYSSKKGFDKSWDECLRVTCAHEFFHAVQNAYNVDADIWWKEASATWNEDEIYKGVNDYVRYIGSYFSSPQKSLDESNYSGVVFAKFLSENHGGYDIIKRIWNVQEFNNNSVTSIDLALKEGPDKKGIGPAFLKFTSFNFNPSQYYSEGSSWKSSVKMQNTYTNYPVTSTSGNLSHLSSCYQLFKTNKEIGGKKLRIMVDTKSRSGINFKLQLRKKKESICESVDISSNSQSGRADILIDDFKENFDELCLIPANIDKTRDGLDYKFAAGFTE